MKKLLIILCGIFLVFAVAGNVGATLYPFDDHTPGIATIYWPTWYNNNGTSWDDGRELIGGPDIQNMYVETYGTTSHLFQVRLDMPNIIGTDYAPSGLFIDNDDDVFWDYYAIDGNLYDVSGLDVQILNTTSHVYAPTFYPYEDYVYSSWTSTDIRTFRQDHPAGIDISGLGTYGDLEYYYYLGQLIFDFSNAPIYLQSDWIIAFTERCANDVTWGEGTGAPVPEPATLLLLGSGLIGLAGIGRRKLRKS